MDADALLRSTKFGFDKAEQATRIANQTWQGYAQTVVESYEGKLGEALSIQRELERENERLRSELTELKGAVPASHSTQPSTPSSTPPASP